MLNKILILTILLIISTGLCLGADELKVDYNGKQLSIFSYIVNAGGTYYKIKVVYTVGNEAPVYTYFDIIIEDTIAGLIAGGVIGGEKNERQIDNCY